MTIRWNLNVIALSVTSSDNATEAFYLLSTLVQALAGVFAISIAVLFLAAQIYTRPQYARAVSEIYDDFLLWVTVLTFLVALGFGVFLITKVNWIVSSGLYDLLTSEVVLSGTALCLFLIAVSEQVANIDPYRFAQRLAQKISVRKILRYKFSDVAYDRDKGTVAYQLHVYGYLHGRSDPLAPIHEIVLWAVKNRDRVAMSALIRLLLSVVARAYGVPYRPTAERDPRPGRVHSIRRRGYMVVCRPLSVEHGVTVALFILTYVVRRAQRLIEEWEGLDIVRQQYILNIRDLIRALAYRTKADVAIRLCLYAVLHICLSYSKVKRYGADEALRHYYSLANELLERGKVESAELCVTIMAVLCQRTDQIPAELCDAGERSLNRNLVDAYLDAINRVSCNVDWLPGDESIDPWRYRVSTYDMAQEKSLIIRP